MIGWRSLVVHALLERAERASREPRRQLFGEILAGAIPTSRVARSSGNLASIASTITNAFITIFTTYLFLRLRSVMHNGAIYKE